jgi:hypothetical protein
MAVWWPNQHGRAGVRSKMHEACGGRSDGAIQSEHCYQIPSLGEHRQRLLSTTGFSIFKDILILEGFGYCGGARRLHLQTSDLVPLTNRGAPSSSLAFEARTMRSEATVVRPAQA